MSNLQLFSFVRPVVICIGIIILVPLIHCVATAATEKEKLDALPSLWDNIALPYQSRGGQLTNSDFLWEIKDRVKISIVPFVHLEDTPEFEIVQLDSKDDSHIIVFSIVMKATRKKASFIAFGLKETGLFYQWNEATISKYNDTTFYRNFNRILLSKLQIEVQGLNSKEIALWSPIVFTATEFEKEKDNKGFFALWKPDETGKEFVLDRKDKEWLLLDFDKIVQLGRTYEMELKTFEKLPNSLAYAPIISELKCGVIVMPNEKEDDLNVSIKFTSEELKSLLEALDSINKQGRTLLKELPGMTKLTEGAIDKAIDGKNRNSDGQLNEIDYCQGMIRQEQRKILLTQGKMAKLPSGDRRRITLGAEINQFRKNIDSFDTRIGRAQKRIDRNDADVQMYSSRQAEFDRIVEARDAIQRKIADEQLKWQGARIDQFTIDLVKSETTAQGVHKSENRLRLFQVIPD